MGTGFRLPRLRPPYVISDLTELPHHAIAVECNGVGPRPEGDSLDVKIDPR